MSLVVSLDTEVQHRYVFELRYRFGYSFWDRSGSVCESVLRRFDDWRLTKIDAERASLLDDQTNCALNFGHAKLDVSQGQNAEVSEIMPCDEFGKLTETLAGLVIEKLRVSDFSRIGFRQWFLYPAGSYEESQQLMGQLGSFRVSDSLLRDFGPVEERSFRAIVSCPTHQVRVAVTPFEQAIDLPPGVIEKAHRSSKDVPKNQKRVLLDTLKAKRQIENYPQFGILVDLDAFIEEPDYPQDFSISEFVKTAADNFDGLRKHLLAAAQ